MANIQQTQQMKIRLGDNLDVSGVQALYGELKQMLEGGDSLSVDASGVDRIDTASLQMLVSVVICTNSDAEVIDRVRKAESARDRCAIAIGSVYQDGENTGPGYCAWIEIDGWQSDLRV